MKKQFKEKWVKALRSGRYEQCREELTNFYGRHCCLGVLCRINRFKHLGAGEYVDHEGNKFGDVASELDPEQRSYFGITKRQQEKLIKMNDEENKSFEEIADYIEKRL